LLKLLLHFRSDIFCTLLPLPVHGRNQSPIATTASIAHGAPSVEASGGSRRQRIIAGSKLHHPIPAVTFRPSPHIDQARAPPALKCPCRSSAALIARNSCRPATSAEIRLLACSPHPPTTPAVLNNVAGDRRQRQHHQRHTERCDQRKASCTASVSRPGPSAFIIRNGDQIALGIRNGPRRSENVDRPSVAVQSEPGVIPAWRRRRGRARNPDVFGRVPLFVDESFSSAWFLALSSAE